MLLLCVRLPILKRFAYISCKVRTVEKKKPGSVTFNGDGKIAIPIHPRLW